MKELTLFLTFALALSTATERVTEMIKGALGEYLVPKENADVEDTTRKNYVVLISFLVGSAIAALLPGQLIKDALNIKAELSRLQIFVVPIFCGALASSGSGFWNSLLGIVREVDQQKQQVTKAVQDFPLLARIDANTVTPGQSVVLKGQALWGDEVALVVNDYPQPGGVAVKPNGEVKFVFPAQNPIQQAQWNAAGENAQVALRLKRGDSVIQTEPILVVVK